MNYKERIVEDPKICNGQATIKGTRITTKLIMEYLEDTNWWNIIGEYPQLTKDDLKAAVLWEHGLIET